MRIVFATGNKGKMNEIREIMADVEVEVLSMKEAGIEADPEENGTTFEENSLIKSKAIFEMLSDEDKKNTIVLADDSGLVVDGLNGEPGIYSARYMGKDTSYDLKNQNLIDRLNEKGMVDPKERSARFVCCVSGVFPDGSSVVRRGTIEGYIGLAPMGENGFGFDPIFYLYDRNISTASIPPEEKNSISHRGNALRMIKEDIKRYTI